VISAGADNEPPNWVTTPAVVIRPICPVVLAPPPNSVNQRLPSGPAVIPAGSDNALPNSVIVPTDEAVGVGEGVALGDELGTADGLEDGRAVGVADGAVDGTLPPLRIGATGAPLLPLLPPHPQKTARTTIVNAPW